MTKPFAPITKHPIDRTALIAGLMFSFSGLAYLVNDHNIANVSEGAATGGVVIILGLAVLLSVLAKSDEDQAYEAATAVADPAAPTTIFGTATPAEPAAAPDFSWASATTTDQVGGATTDEFEVDNLLSDEAE